MMELATQLYVITYDGQYQKPHIVGGLPISLDRCRTFSNHGETEPKARHAYVCVKAPVWVVDWRNWRLVGRVIFYKDSKGNLPPWRDSRLKASVGG